MGEMLICLVVNAREAMPAGGTLCIRARNVTKAQCQTRLRTPPAPADHVLIEVADDGIGTPDDMMRMDLVGAFAPPWRDVQAVKGTVPPSLSGLRGRVVLIDFWATWCVPCRIVMPKLSALQAHYGAQGLTVVGLSTEDAEEVLPFTQRMVPGYSVGVDTHAETARAYGVVSLPTLVVIDKRGVVRDVAVGYTPGEDARLEDMVKALLQEPAPRE